MAEELRECFEKLQAQLGLSFETAAERNRWYDNTFARPLRNLVKEGLVERE